MGNLLQFETLGFEMNARKLSHLIIYSFTDIVSMFWPVSPTVFYYSHH